ncbi:MAG: hypothetical protein LBH74_02440 [Nitrososphaerota archaeon]|jgi:hypothetical protein|nr:hypothetical protein [Nitrososphaerota archaeon]
MSTDTPPQTLITSDIQNIIDAEQAPITATYSKFPTYKKELDEKQTIEDKVIAIINADDIKEEFTKLFINEEIAKEDHNFAEVLLNTMISAYTESPMNTRVTAPSAEGKSYVTYKVAGLFPIEDRLEFGKTSPQSWLRAHGTEYTADGRLMSDIDKPVLSKTQFNIYWESNSHTFNSKDEAWNDYNSKFKMKLREWEELKANSYTLVNVKHKIIILVEATNASLEAIKPLLSHDNLNLVYRTYDSDSGHNLNVKFDGYPAVILNDAEKEYNEELLTRFMIVSPTSSESKYEASIQIKVNTTSNIIKKKQIQEHKHVVSEVIRRIKKLYTDNKITILQPLLIPNFDNNGSKKSSEKLNIKDAFRSKTARDQRDFNKYYDLIPAMGIFNIMKAPIIEICGEKYQLATINDALLTKKLYDRLAKITKNRMPGDSFNLYQKYIRPHPKGKTAKGIIEDYNKNRTPQISQRTIYSWLEVLENQNYIEKTDNRLTTKSDNTYIDERYTTIKPLQLGEKPVSEYMIDTETDAGLHTFKELLEEAFIEWWGIHEPIIRESGMTPKILDCFGGYREVSMKNVKQYVLTGKCIFDEEENPQNIHKYVKSSASMQNCTNSVYSSKENQNENKVEIQPAEDIVTYDSKHGLNEQNMQNCTNSIQSETIEEQHCIIEAHEPDNNIVNDKSNISAAIATVYPDSNFQNNNDNQTQVNYYRTIMSTRREQCACCKKDTADYEVFNKEGLSYYLCLDCFKTPPSGYQYIHIREKPN